MKEYLRKVLDDPHFVEEEVDYSRIKELKRIALARMNPSCT